MEPKEKKKLSKEKLEEIKKKSEHKKKQLQNQEIIIKPELSNEKNK